MDGDRERVLRHPGVADVAALQESLDSARTAVLPDVDGVQERAISRAAKRQQARDAELQECGERLQQLLAEYDAIFAVVAITRYPNGAAITTHQVNIIDGRSGR